MKIKKISVGQEQTFYTDTCTKKRMRVGIEAELVETDNVNEVYSYLKEYVQSKFKSDNSNEVIKVPLDCINNLSLPNVDMTSDNVPDIAPIIKPFNPSDPNLKITCPLCGNYMVLRTGKRGKFWGCSSFRDTNCKGIVGLNQVEEYLDSGILPSKHITTTWHNI